MQIITKIKKVAASFKSFILVQAFCVNTNLSCSYCDTRIHTYYILVLA